ncbi:MULTISPECIES: hypothetical protein [Pseudanabaena]|uniref:Uncharacterized protein n=1 Tax=Pseudanabaena catenata USMAC16 TaxID=1855837 RepID=A0A9X4M638_9CYAN|nr:MULTISPECIES: hypothetical protein [Pseudanabaena]MDG3494466.1 hypothetical protein [Pseudanabaena catenata USMAC16]
MNWYKKRTSARSADVLFDFVLMQVVTAGHKTQELMGGAERRPSILGF